MRIFILHLFKKINFLKSSFLIATVLLISSAVNAQTVTVNTTADENNGNTSNISALKATPGGAGISIREAIIAANNEPNGASVTITIPAGTYNLNLYTAGETSNAYNAASGDLDITAATVASTNKTIIINGAGATTTTINQTVGGERVIEVHSGSAASFPGSITFTLTDVTLTGGTPSSSSGGAILAGRPGDVTTITNCTFTNNTSSGPGGALSVSSGSASHNLTVTGCTFNNNKSTNGSGGAISFNGNGTSTVVIDQNKFTNNTSSIADGGAINISGTSPGANNCNITRNTFTGNSANTGGAAIVALNVVTINVNYNRIVANTSPAATGIMILGTGGTITTFNTDNNWWGVNTGPGASDIAGSTAAKWLQLKTTASAATVCAGGSTATFTASFLSNSNNEAISTANLVPEIGLPITFTNPVLGTLSGAQATIQASGTATVTYTSGSTGGTGSVNAVVDNIPNNDVAPAKGTITVDKPVVANPSTSTGTVNAAFSQTFTQSGGTAPVTFALNSGTLPTGLALAANGTLSGTPTQSGTFPITVKVTDNNSCVGVGSTYNLVINCQTISVTNPSTTTGTVNTAFSQTFAQSGAVGGATFTINTGTLPTGLNLSTSGVLSGTPTQSGSFPITVKVTDGNGCTGTGSSYSLMINSAPVSLTINDVTLNEGNSGTTTFTFTVSLSSASASTVTVNYVTADGTAISGSDYTAASGTLTFPPGVTSQNITVLVNGDVTFEQNETFFVNLSSAANATIADAQGQGTIVNDDTPPSITINDVSQNEGNSGTTSFTFTVNLSAASGLPVTVNYATADNTATTPSDYTAASGTLTFSPGVTTQTITVLVNGDVIVEPNETFFVNLTSPVNATIADGQGLGTIVNDDAPAIITYYPRTSSTDLSQTSNWTNNINGGAGTSPSNFSSANQLFNINRDAPLTGTLDFSGGSNMEINSAALTIAQSGRLSINTGSTGDFNNNHVIIKSSATGTASIGVINGTLSNATNVTVERYISSLSNRAYRLLGSSVTTTTNIRTNWQEGATSSTSNPVPGFGTHITGSTTGANGFDATQSGQSSLFTYNQTTQGYTGAANTSTAVLNAKTGYLLYVRGDRSIDLTSTASPLPSTNTTLRATGTLLTGTQTFSGLAANNFSLVTNPYASAINWSSIYTNNAGSFSNYYTYLDPNVGSRGGYVTVTNTGTVSPAPSGGIPAGTVNIQSGQAFFVNSTTTSPTLTIQESDKTANNNIDVFRTTTPASQKFTTSLYYNDAEHGRKLADGVTSLYDATYNAAIDGNDAEEVSNFDENIAIARGDKHLSIEERPIIKASDTLSLFMSNIKQQSYELEFNPANLNPNTTAQLVDKFTGTRTSIDVASKTVVPFTVSAVTASGASDRFYIVFAAAASLPVTITNAIFVKVYPNPLSTNVINMQLNLVKGSYTFSLTNKLGQQILNKVIQYPGGLSTQSLTPLQTLAAGVYQLQVTGNGISVTQQVLKD